MSSTFQTEKPVTECSNLAFMGSNVISGSAEAVVILTGNQTLFGGIAKSLDAKREPTGFEKGISSVSWLLIRFMLVMVPIVFVINGITKDDWMEALLFAISIAVGLTPEMLPMIVTTCRERGGCDEQKENHHQEPVFHPEPGINERSLHRQDRDTDARQGHP